MKQDTTTQLVFTGIAGKKVIAEFEDVAMSSDGGILLAAEVERCLGLIDRLAACITDPRQRGKVVHEIGDMLRQRTLQIVRVMKMPTIAIIWRTIRFSKRRSDVTRNGIRIWPRSPR